MAKRSMPRLGIARRRSPVDEFMLDGMVTKLNRHNIDRNMGEELDNTMGSWKTSLIGMNFLMVFGRLHCAVVYVFRYCCLAQIVQKSDMIRDFEHFISTNSYFTTITISIVPSR